MTIHQFSFPTLIRFGPGACQEVPGHLTSHPFRRPLVVTDQGIAPLPFFKDFLKDLEKVGLRPGVFSEVWGNPMKSQVQAAVETFRAHQADCLIGLGGGAALDVAKAVVLMVHHPGDLFDYEDEKLGALPIDKEIPYWIALPTTSGTGSEVGRSSVISDDKTHLKKIIFSPRLMAKLVFADPELTLGLPASVTAATGMDALTHCVESYLAKGYHPLCDGIALEGLRLAARSLPLAVKEPRHLEARSSMMMASLMGAVAFQKGLGLTHSCAHALSTVADLHHGLANGLMIDYALKQNVAAVPERFQILAQTVGLSEKVQNGEGFIHWLTALKSEIGIPSRLSEMKIQKIQLVRLSEIAFQDVCHQNNPKSCTLEDFQKIFTEAF